MGKITFVMDDKIEDQLRRTIEGRKGALGQALSEGAKLWINYKTKTTRMKGYSRVKQRLVKK